MRISLLLRLCAIALATLCLAPPVTFANTGNDNPTGACGAFNGNSTTGDSYDPYTGNATRTIPDIVVSGAVGAYPLVWARTLNSRGGGVAGGAAWHHSYQWSGSVGTYLPREGTPSSYTIHYPDGRVITFPNSSLGITDRFQGASGTDYCYLFLSDGGIVRFIQTGTYDRENETWSNLHLLPPDQITDPHGLVTTLAYNAASEVIQVTEPAGRWLKVYWSNYTVNHVDAGYGAGTVIQSVAYTYASQSFDGTPYTVLTKATYSDGTSATYTYQNSNVSASGYPLIKTCADVRYPGPMKNIAYTFVAGGAYGQLYQEKDINGTVVVTLTMSGTTRTETRGDGPSRTFQYGSAGQPYSVPAPYLLGSFSDFKGIKTYYGYDTHGFRSTIRDRNGHVTTFVNLATTGAVTKVTHPGDGSYILYGYDATGHFLTSATDELHHTTTYRLNADKTPYEVDHPDGGIEKFTYNSFKEVLTHTMVSNATGTTGGTESFTYDSRGLLKTSYPPATPSDPNPAAHPTKYVYDVNDHLSTITDPRGNVTTLYHNQRGQLTIIQHPDPDQSLIGYAYNADGTLALTSVQYGPGPTDFAETDYTYDDYKRVLTVSTPGDSSGDTYHVTKFWYDNTGTTNDYTHTDANPTFIVTPAGVHTVNSYDNNFRLLSRTIGDTSRSDSKPAITSYTYDPAGNRITMTEPNGQPGEIYVGKKWTYYYDARNRLTAIDDPISTDRNSLNHTISYTYDVASNKTSEQRANDQLITYNTYDAMNRLTQMTVSQAPTAAAVTKYTWTKAGKVDTMTDPRSKIYNYDYDAQNRLITTTYPADSGGAVRTETRAYDFAGNLATFKNRAGNKQTFQYDSRNREIRYDWDDGITPARGLLYDDASRMTVCNSSSVGIHFAYYHDGLLKSQEEWINYYGDGANHRTTSYKYDRDGRRSLLTYPSTEQYTYTYTPRSEPRVTYETGNPNWQTYYIYDPSGNRSTRYLNAYQTRTSSSYDALNRLTQAQHILVGKSPRFNYAYDEISNRKYEQRDGSLADGFGYNLNNELTSFRRDGSLSGGTVSGGILSTLLLDASGNRTNLTTDGVPTTYVAANNLNQYPSVGGLGATYDGNGNLKTYDGWTYTYDAMNRLTKAAGPAHTMYFYYDALNRQVTRNLDGHGLVYFSVWDGWNLIAEYTQANTLNTEYLHGAGSDELVSMTRSGQRYYFFQDGRGNTSHATNSSGQLVESYKYDVFGVPTIYNSAGNQISASAIGNRFLFTGREYFQELGLYNYRNRFYSPEWGRFLQPDPIGFSGDASNIYRYCANNPVNWSDPSGLVDAQGSLVAYIPKRKDGNDSDNNPASGTSSFANDFSNLTSFGGGNIGGYGNGEPAGDSPLNQVRTFTPAANSNNVAQVPGFNLARQYFPGTGGIMSLNLNGSVTEMIPLFSDGISDATGDVANALSLLSLPRDAFLLGAGLAGLAENGLTTVIHFTSAEGVSAITEAGVLRAGSYVSLPGEVAGLNAAGVESALEIQAGRGAFSTTFEVPNSFLQVPANGVRTSGGALQFQLTQPAVPGAFIPTP